LLKSVSQKLQEGSRKLHVREISCRGVACFISHSTSCSDKTICELYLKRRVYPCMQFPFITFHVTGRSVSQEGILGEGSFFKMDISSCLHHAKPRQFSPGFYQGGKLCGRMGRRVSDIKIPSVAHQNTNLPLFWRNGGSIILLRNRSKIHSTHRLP
jgi:hypothetical protein